MTREPPMDQVGVTAAKARLRRELLARRGQRTDAQRERAATSLATRATDVPGLAAATTVAAYVGVGHEIDTAPLLAALAARALAVLLPVISTAGLDWAAYDGRLVPGPHGLLEPVGPRLGPIALAAADLALVPALAVDGRGHRLGRGGGYYDRALAAAATLPAYAIVDDDEVLDAVPVAGHDRPVTGALTPTRVLLLPVQG